MHGDAFWGIKYNTDLADRKWQHIQWSLGTSKASIHLPSNRPFLALCTWLVPSGKPLHNYGKSPFLMGKSTISMAIFNSYVCLPEGI